MGPCVHTDGNNLAVCILNVFLNNMYKNIDDRSIGCYVLILQSNNMAKYSLMSRFTEDRSQLKGKETNWGMGWESLII